MFTRNCPQCNKQFVYRHKGALDRAIRENRKCYSCSIIPVEDRFWSKVNKNGPTIRPELGSCWNWVGGKCGDGYGAFWSNNRYVSAHCFSWELHNGPIPEGMQVLHHCDYPPCCRPDHLFLGTVLDNMRDRDKKGRHPPLCGEANGFSKLTENDVHNILSDTSHTQQQLAKQFGVYHTTIYKIKHGKIWKHIK